MSWRGLGTLTRAELRRTRGALSAAGLGVLLGTASLTFFLGLGLGVRATLLEQVFPIDRVELVPAQSEVGLLALLGGRSAPPGVDEQTAEELRRLPAVEALYPKLMLRFPSMARGGKEVLGQELGTHEMLADGVDPELVEPPLRARFTDPWSAEGKPCVTDAECADRDYCERPSGAATGRCSRPVPALVSRYLVELFDHGVAPAHGLPAVAGELLSHAEVIPFTMTLGNSLLGRAPQGSERRVKLQVIGVSPRAIDLGVTVPLAVARRWNTEYAGAAAAARSSSVVVQLRRGGDASRVLEAAAARGLQPKDTRARDVSVLTAGIMALLSLVSGVILLVAGLNIAHTLRSLVAERRQELALYRALGASAALVRRWVLALALTVGASAGAAGVALAWLLSLLVDWRAAVDLPAFPFKPASFFAFPPWLLALGVGFGVLSALLGAARPAWRASRVDPAAVLGRQDG